VDQKIIQGHFIILEVNAMIEFSHIDADGKAKMVDVSHKPAQERLASAKGRIYLHPETIVLIQQNLIKKGDVISIAEIAGIMAAKRTSELIPLCHPLFLSSVNVKAQFFSEGIELKAEAKTIGQTGVEMEALTAISVGLLTIYDMCKAVDKSMKIGEIQLVEKIKGKIWKNDL
jgi:cyclic pyranopterin phosphate synthase